MATLQALQRASYAACLAASLVAAQSAGAVELGIGEYFLGLTIPMSGYVPPPGVYFWDTFFISHGNSERIDINFRFNIASAGYFLKTDVLGGATLGFVATVPFIGDQNSVPAAYTASSGITYPYRQNASFASIGDSDYSMVLGWHAGDNNWLFTLTGFAPTGNYDPNRFVQSGLNRPALDIKGAYTFLSLQTGFEVSGALGTTFNAYNTASNYQSGVELHFEWALNQHFPNGLAAGIGGFFYRQLTNDYGPGDTVGAYKGRVASVGPLLSYSLKVDGQEVDFSARWYHEFAVENRTRGNAIWTTIGFRL
jgi:hypothetical protein